MQYLYNLLTLYFSAIWDLLPFCDEMEQKQKDRTAKMFADLDASEFVKRRKLEDGSYITEMPLRYFRYSCIRSF